MDSSTGGSESSFRLDPAIGSLPPPTPGEPDDLVERICRFMTKHQTSTKKFLLSYLTSKNRYVVTRKKQWGSVKKGWKTTEEILDAIDKLVNAKPKCREKWNDWVLKKAKVIVAAQSPPTGSLYININKLDQTFFDHKMDVERDVTVIQSMNFIHELISFKLGLDESQSDSPLAESYVYHKSTDKAENTTSRLKAVSCLYKVMVRPAD
ncbi:uncharacterized protein MELLADRAFT_114102 [Melampsora larici-populina 98AG31]|uniref:Uncharacterized protein n=1 Tax=Melampsora larici-populina (strain 98AG31 / pathotype 3-4-7) TaxID=747676 RepID=F4SC66_MELLP|nr:uncharacterized protein MELLADRAFT_114102 [Melampsora larici-populina 98AG31]EGF97751.1 hypothetical protein MELLADRAFT_114102 [Melampsora larici-populina 98AG31]